MKRFLGSVFIALLLCQNVSTGQAQTNPGENAHSSSSAAKQEVPTNHKPEPEQESADNNNNRIIGEPDSSLVERIAKITSKANWALFFSALATLFAWLSWISGRNANRINEEVFKHTKLRERGWLDVVDLEITEYSALVSTMDDQGRADVVDHNDLPADGPEFFNTYYRKYFTVNFAVKNIGNSVVTDASFFIDSIDVQSLTDRSPRKVVGGTKFCASILPNKTLEFSETYKLSVDVSDDTQVDFTRNVTLLGKILYFDGVTETQGRRTSFEYFIGPVNQLKIGEVSWQTRRHT